MSTESDSSAAEDTPDGFVTPQDAREGWNAIERVKAALGIEDDFAAATIANQTRLGQLLVELRNAVTELSAIRDPDIIGEFPIEMSHSVPPNTLDTDPNVVRRTPDKQNEVRVTSISLGWPDGTNNAVGIQVRTGNGQKLLPRNPEDQFIAFNKFTETFDLRYKLEPGEDLEAVTVNFDTSNDHFVNIVPQVEEIATEDSSNTEEDN